jgi:hypothetical protein
MMAAVASIIVGGASQARADQTIIATVPFDFIAGATRFPAGDYVLTEKTEQGILSIVSRDSQHAAIVLTLPASSDDATPLSELVFERFGGEHFLARITGGGLESREIPLTEESMMSKLRAIALEPSR